MNCPVSGALSADAISLPAARQYCRRLATTHYENFTVVSWLLPRHLRQHFYNVYAYCRLADDLGDEITNASGRYDAASRARSLGLLAWWRVELMGCYPPSQRGDLEGDGDRPAGERTLTEWLGRSGIRSAHPHPVMVALKDTIEMFSIPAEPFLNLITAFEQDQRVAEYETYEQLLGYCCNSADPVGRLVLYLCRAFNAASARLSDCVCTGLQLVNFWQDVARDLDRGRIYLPRADCERFGYPADQLRRRVYNEAFRSLMQHQVKRARGLLEQGIPLVARVPGVVQVDIELFIRGGLTILDKIEAIDYNVWRSRPVLTKRDHLRLFGRCSFAHLWHRLIGQQRSGSRIAPRV